MHPSLAGGTEVEYRQIDCDDDKENHARNQDYQYWGYQRGESADGGEWSVVSSRQSVAHAG